MTPAQIQVVLVEPAFGGNVGSVARAMANMGVSTLKLVGGVSLEDADARRMAVSARPLLEQAQRVDSLKEAVQGCHLVIGSTARHRKVEGASRPLWDLGALLNQAGDTAQVALVFGRERSGLTNQELSVCTHQITIPTFGEYASLNLAQAALLLLYECSKTFGSPGPVAHDRAESQEVEGLKQHLFELLTQVGFLKSPDREDSVWLAFADLLNRGGLSPKDVQMLRGVCNRVQLTLQLKPPRKAP